MKVGFIGLGRMGQAMARRLLEAKHSSRENQRACSYSRSPRR